MHADPAVAAVTQALAQLDGIPINQTILQQAEKAVEAASCGVSGCRLLKHDEGVHDWEGRQAIDDREELASALRALLDIYGYSAEPFIAAIENILAEHGRSTDARSGSH